MNRTLGNVSFDIIYKELVKILITDPDYITSNRKHEDLKELVNPTFTLTNPINCFALSRNLSIPYLKGELEFYNSGSPYLKDIVKYSKFWSKVSDDGVTINSNYGRLLLHDRNSHNLTQFEYALSCLKRNPDSKKAVMTIYNKDHARETNDNPCTMYLQFVLRKNRLHLLVKMRSSDVWFGLPYDVPFFVSIQCKMAKELGVELGYYVHNSGSLHMYQRNEKELEKVTEAPVSSHKEQKKLFNEIFKGEYSEYY